MHFRISFIFITNLIKNINRTRQQRPHYQLTTEMVKGQIIRIRLIPIKRSRPPILYISSRFRQDTIDLVQSLLDFD